MTFAKACHDHGGRLPDRYDKWPYRITRMFMPFVCGTIPWIFDAETPLIAFYLGASAPLLVDKLAKGTLPSPDSPKTERVEDFPNPRE